MLNMHSYFSLRYGVVPPSDLLALLQAHGYPRFALTDINSSSAVLSHVREAQEAGLTPCVGIDFRNGVDQQYVGLAKNNRGFNALNIFLSQHLHSGTPFPARPPHMTNTLIIYPWAKAPAQLGPNEWIGVSLREVNRLALRTTPEMRQRMVILQPMTFRRKNDHNAHRLLRAIENNCLLAMLPKSEEAPVTDMFMPYAQLCDAFADYPEIVENTENLLKQCSIHFAFGEEAEPQNLATYTGNRAEDLRMLYQLAYEGIAYRYGERTPEVVARIEKEIEVINQKDYLSYFLITWDIVSYARSKGYYYVGRGSGANSIVAYLLRITDVDPLKLDLYFERFINLFRKNPPDFDIDFSTWNREDVTRYIFETFPSATLLCVYSCFKESSSVREIAKIFGLPKAEIDRLVDGDFVYAQLDQVSRLVLKYTDYIQELPNMLSVHSSGIIIPQHPATWYSGTFVPPKGYPTTQFSMLEAEDVGLFKFDVLGQRGLAKIEAALEIIAENQPDNPPHDIHDVEFMYTDRRINQMLSEGRAIGCFYVESPAMRLLLIKLKVDNYLLLVAASSIIRPGVSSSGMMHEFIKRHHDPEERKKAHPIMLEIMPDTYGVMVYQEDVIKVANVFAGLDLGEADVLRRGMSGKFRSRQEFQRVKDKFFSNCHDMGHAPDLTAEIWRQIESFAGYSFAKGHSASYAVESYQVLYLKCYYPLEYMVATINKGGGFYSTELYVHEARMLGGEIEPPSVNFGSFETVIRGKTIYLGFMMVKGLEEKAIMTLLSERARGGPYKDFADVLRRAPVTLDQMRLIIRIGGFRDLNTCKKTLLWQALNHLNRKKQEPAVTLFEAPVVKYTLPEFEVHPLEEAFEQLELLGFTLWNPLGLLAEQPDFRTVTKRELPQLKGQQVEFLGYFFHAKRTSTKKNEIMCFGTFLDIEGEHVDTVHFPQALERYPFRGKGVYRVRGKVTEEFGTYSIEVQWQARLPFCEDVRYSEISCVRLG